MATVLEFAASELSPFDPRDVHERQASGLGEVGLGESGVFPHGSDLLSGWRRGWRVGDHAVDLPGDVAFQAADDVSLGQSFGAAALHVVDGALIALGEPGHHDPPERVVGVAIAGVVEAVPAGLARRGGDRCGATQVSERFLTLDPVVVVTEGDQ